MTPQEEKDLVLRVVTRLAQTQLGGQGLYPFGATLANRNMNLLIPDSMKQNPTSDELEAYWVRELRESVAKSEGACSAACFCAAVHVPVEEGGTAPALMIHLEHAVADAEVLFYLYWKDKDSQIVLGKPTSVSANRMIFASP